MNGFLHVGMEEGKCPKCGGHHFSKITTEAVTCSACGYEATVEQALKAGAMGAQPGGSENVTRRL